MSYINNLYKKIILLKEKKIFFLLFCLTIHFFIIKNIKIIFYNFVFQILLQILFFLKIKNFTNKIYLILIIFLIFTISILFLGINWIMINFKK
ncbi:hypothetical protein CUN91_00400 [Candidatus Carsonella ruddii]|uniref:Cytochrome O ubiquinol oxidase subunit IV n=2 Tax=Carsonella ruddii TaxID=114186 RepID=A0A2K8K481_CARRU|nr:hypothetical protein CUN91_00400 [Candidatus Carsonella ruddii]